MLLKIVIPSSLVLMLIISCSNDDSAEKNYLADQKNQSGQAAQPVDQTAEKTNDISQPIHVSDESDFEISPPFSLSVESGRISSTINNVRLKRVLKELGLKANIRISISSAITETSVTVNFNDIPLKQGISKILAKQNYTLIYEDINTNKLDSNQTGHRPKMRIAELRLVSDYKPAINAQDINKELSLAEAAVTPEERNLFSLKARIEDALADSDSVALNELRQEVQDHSDPEAAAELFDEAMEEYDDELEGIDATAGSLFGRANNTEKSSTKKTLAQTNNAVNNQIESSAKSGIKDNFSDLQARAYSALQTSDPQAIHEVVREVVTHPDQEGAMAAFYKASK